VRVLVQWTRATPSDWLAVDSAAWQALPKRPAPVGGETIDDGPGWVHRVCVQGVSFAADHYAVEHVPGQGCRVSAWNDDPTDYPPGLRHARVWMFRPLRVDPAVGRRWNTAQSQVIYAEPQMADRMVACATPRGEIRDYSEFVPPAAAHVRHGIMVADELNAAHDAARTTRGWREWTEGVPARELVSIGGRIIVRRDRR